MSDGRSCLAQGVRDGHVRLGIEKTGPIGRLAENSSD